ncbi:MAG: type IV secretion system protein [Rickettsiales bacterium]|jgi:hypothetical protein|nr:type IV secretion system protein [Rickettsiales bacterium]
MKISWKNVFSCLLILASFSNVLLFSPDEASASITREVVMGPRDRVRRFKNGGSDSELDFKYSSDSGFSCKPGGLKFFSPSDLIDSASDNSIVDAITGFGTFALSIVLQILLNPILCVSILTAFGNAIGGNGLLASIEMLVIALGMESLSFIEDFLYGEDDYNLDPHNPMCLGVTIGMFVSCIAMMVIFKISSLSWTKRIIIIMSISALMQTAKEIIKGVQYARAKGVFGTLSLCGDNWYTYGGADLEEALLAQNRSGSNITLNNIKVHFPMKGSFFGSHSYILSKCFSDRDSKACGKVFSLTSMTDEDINLRSSEVYKEYREFLYEGVEYAYEGCKDPRVERQSYASTSDKTSQLYYFRGSEAANFACERFLGKSAPEYREAYKCCLESSQKLICIFNNEQVSGTNGVYTMCNKDDSPGVCKINSDSGTVPISITDISSSSTENCRAMKKEIVDGSDICSVDGTLTNSSCASGGEGCCDAFKEYNNICGSNGSLSANNISSTVGDSGGSDQSKASSEKNIKLKIVQSKFDSTKYCVETYNFCPYDFRIMGGSETYGTEFSSSYESGFKVKLKGDSETEYEQDTRINEIIEKNRTNNCTFDEDGNRHCMGPCYSSDGELSACFNRPSNFCQIDRHCVRIAPLDEVPKDYNSPYIDFACINSVGSSHNFTNYKAAVGITSRSTRLLVAPLVECTVETFKNILMNRAGHTRCVDGNESPSEYDDCASGIFYKKGQSLDNMVEYQNSFKKLKNYMIRVVRALLALAVVLYGYKIAIMQKGFTTEEISKFILTMICVSYFSISNNWIPYVFSGVYRVYGIVTEFALGLVADDSETMHYDNPKYSGCHFSESKYINNYFSSYGERQYMSVFDTLDCKLSRYFGYYTNNVANPPILAILIMGVFSFGLAILMIIPILLVFVALFFFVIRAAYIFIVNSLTITILLFLSPIFIPLVLFERTKTWFSSWLVRIMQHVMSPLFLFMSLSLFFTVFDKYYVGDAIFKGNREPIRDVYCGKICKVNEGKFFYIGGNEEEISTQEQECALARGKVINLVEESALCLMTRGSENQVDTNISILNLIIRGFTGVPGLAIQVANFFQMFSTIIFLLVLIFIFEQMNAYINGMTSALFSYNNIGFKGIDAGASGLPGLKEVMSTVASAGAKLANATKEPGKAGLSWARNKIDGRKENKALKDDGKKGEESGEKEGEGEKKEGESEKKDEKNKNDNGGK